MFRRPAALATLGRPYVPILLAKRGEREALGRLTPEIWTGLTPWLRIVPPELRSREDDSPPAAEMSRLAGVMGDRGLYLDSVGTPRRRRSSRVLGVDYVQPILEAAVAAGLAFAPVYPFGRRDLAATISAFGQEDLGAAVLLTAGAALAWGSRRLDGELRHEVNDLAIAPEKIDLMVDLGYVGDGSDEISSVLWLVRQAVSGGAWRSVILAGTSVPDSLAEAIPDDSLNAIDRRERALFDNVQARLDIRLRYSDYAVQHPVPPAPGAAPKMRASIRYTAGDHMYVSRGGRPVGEIPREEVPAQYRELAERLRIHPPFAGRGCCWGDRFIEDMSDGRLTVRTQQKMRAVATCHHLSAVARERAARPARPAARPVVRSRRSSRDQVARVT
jgi:hypothetical protein